MDKFTLTKDQTRNQAYLMLAFTVSTAGDWLYRLALPLLVLQMTGSAIGAALAYAIEYLPYLFFSMVGGIAADRTDRRRLLIAADLTAAAIVILLTVVVSRGLSQVWLVFLVAFLLSSVRPVYHPTFQSMIPSLVSVKNLTRTNARIQAIDSIFLVVGPVLGVGVIISLGIATTLWLNAASFAVSALALACIRLSNVSGSAAAKTVRPQQQIRSDIIEVIHYLRADRVILNGSLIMAGSAASLMMVEANLIFYLVTLRQLPVSTVGVVLGTYGVGSVIGALGAPLLCRRFPPGILVAAALLCAGLFTGLLAINLGIVAMAVLWACVGACVMAVIVIWFSLRQQIVPQRLLGRVVAASRMLAYAATPVGALIGAWLFSTAGGAPTIILSAAIQVAVAAMAFGTVLRIARFPASTVQPA